MAENPQVYAPWDASRADARTLIPRFKYDGGNPVQFVRDFPIVASAIGVSKVYKWRDDKEIDDEKEEKCNNTALMILRQYLTERVLSVVMVGQPKLAVTVYRAVETIFITNDARTKGAGHQRVVWL